MNTVVVHYLSHVLLNRIYFLGFDNVKTILKWTLCWEGMAWMHVAQDMDQWRAHVNTVTNL